MQTRLKVSGHPIQPMLVTVPLGLFVCAGLFDLAAVASGFAFVGEVGYWTAVAGLFVAALSAIAGVLDLWAVPVGAVRRTAVRFNLANVAMGGLFLCVCLLRAGTDHAASAWYIPVEALALGVGIVGAWLGANLVRQFDVDGEPVHVLRPMAREFGRRPGEVRL